MRQTTIQKLLVFLLTTVLSLSGSSQTIAMPYSLAVLKNKVKEARIYFEAKDGKRYMQKELHYDKNGRLIFERENEHSFYYTYRYDDKNRMSCTTQRSANGNLIQKFTISYNEKDSSRTVILFSNPLDSLQATYLYVYDKNENRIKTISYVKGEISVINIVRYDKNGEVYWSYDSTAWAREVNIRERLILAEKKLYDINGTLLHQYKYRYQNYENTTWMEDSIPGQKPDRYKVKGAVPYQKIVKDSIWKNDRLIEGDEEKNFRTEFWYLFPRFMEEEMAYGLPVPELINEHHLTYDRKGNIIRDDLVQRQGSSSDTYVYTYEYIFYR